MARSRKLWGCVAIVGAIVGSSGCAAENAEDEPVADTEDAFRERQFSWLASSSLVEPATRGTIRVKLVHAAPLAMPWEDWMRDGIDKWLAPMRVLPGAKDLKPNVVLVTKDEDIVLEVHAGEGRAVYHPGNPFGQQRIDVYEKDGRGFTVLLHELGHAFGLGDTYVEGKWTCASDQPASVMCNADTNDLRADDIRGARYEYCRRTGRCNANNHADTFGGSGGSGYRSTCPEGYRLAGFDVRHGEIIDYVKPLCTNANGSLYYIGGVGGSGGDKTTRTLCTNGAYVTSLRVTTQWAWVSSIQVDCSDGKILDPVGKMTGSFGVYACPSAFPAAVGIRGGESAFVDRIGLSCDTASGATFAKTGDGKGRM